MGVYGTEYWLTLDAEEAAEKELQRRLRRVGGHRVLLPDRLYCWRYAGRRAIAPVVVNVRGRPV